MLIRFCIKTIDRTYIKHVELVLSSVDYSTENVNLIPNILIDEWEYYELRNIKYKFYNGNSEWELFAYKILDHELWDYQLNNTFEIYDEQMYSSIIYKFGFQRKPTYFTMTLIIPILALTLLAPVGLILPG